jgi:hypothetical protein
MSTAAPPPPSNNTLVLPLPPGMTGEQYLTLQGQLGSLNSRRVCAACSPLLQSPSASVSPPRARSSSGTSEPLTCPSPPPIADARASLITFKDELTLYTVTSAAAWKQPGTWAFVVLRYASIAALVSALFFTSAQSTNCGFTVRFSSFMVALVVAAAGVIFAYRVLALWKGNKTVYAVLGLFYLVNVGAWMATAASYAADTGPPTPFNSNCQLHPVASWNPISFGSSVVFDCVVLGLTVLKLRQNFGARSTVQKQLYKDNLLYFVIVTATNVRAASLLLRRARADVRPAADRADHQRAPRRAVRARQARRRAVLNGDHDDDGAARVPEPAPAAQARRGRALDRVRRRGQHPALVPLYEARPPAARACRTAPGRVQALDLLHARDDGDGQRLSPALSRHNPRIIYPGILHTTPFI